MKGKKKKVGAGSQWKKVNKRLDGIRGVEIIQQSRIIQLTKGVQ